MSTLPALIDDLVAANRILAGLNVLDGFGHVSVRHPDDANRYLLSRSRTPYLERFIHGETGAVVARLKPRLHGLTLGTGVMACGRPRVDVLP